MTVATKSGAVILKSGSVAQGCACCPPQVPGICGCPPGVQFPTYFEMRFMSFTVSLSEQLGSGSAPNLSATIKSFLEGLGPVIMPRRLSTSSSIVYGRLRCRELSTLATCDASSPPGFWSDGNFQGTTYSSMSFLLQCPSAPAFSGAATVYPYPGIGNQGSIWRITTNPFDPQQFELVLDFGSLNAFSFANICNIGTETSSVLIRPRLQSGFTNNPVSISGDFFSTNVYTGSGTIEFKAIYNPLP